MFVASFCLLFAVFGVTIVPKGVNVASAGGYTVGRYTFREEVVNSLTHGLGTAFSIGGLIVLIVFGFGHFGLTPYKTKNPHLIFH